MDICVHVCVYAVCACTHVVNACASIRATVHIRECTALMSPNRAKQPYMQTECSQFTAPCNALGFGIAHYM